MAREIIYGINPAFELLRCQRRRVYRVWLAENSGARARFRKLAELCAQAGAPVEKVSRGRLAQLAGNAEHQGVVLETDPYPYAALEEILTAPRLLLLDNVEDPQNVGAILRSAEIFGWQAVCLPHKGVPEVYASVVKAAAGATEYLRICRACAATAYVRRARAAGFRLLALDQHGASDVRQVRPAAGEKIMLIVGGEHYGVGRYLLTQVHAVVGIPQAGRVRALNASVAAGIAMFCLAPPLASAP